jgi:hypothetical protein
MRRTCDAMSVLRSRERRALSVLVIALRPIGLRPITLPYCNEIESLSSGMRLPGVGVAQRGNALLRVRSLLLRRLQLCSSPRSRT